MADIINEANYSNDDYSQDLFVLKEDVEDISIDENFASQSFWKEVRAQFLKKKSAVFGLIAIVIITLLAIFGPGMNSYSYSDQDLSQKNLAPKNPVRKNPGPRNPVPRKISRSLLAILSTLLAYTEHVSSFV